MNPTIENNFKYHAPKEGQPQKYEQIRDFAKAFAYLLDGAVPDSREKSLAMTKLEEAVMWANAGIARIAIDIQNNTAVNETEVGEYGYQGWTVEEIMRDVMGVKNIHSELYTTTMDNFSKALDDNDRQTAQKNYDILNKMLHPCSQLRQILRIQMIGMDEN